MKTKIFVHETQAKADKAAHILGLDRKIWHVIGAGSMLAGFRAETIWVMPIEDAFRRPGIPEVVRDNFYRWVDESLRCRLLPDGEIHFL